MLLQRRPWLVSAGSAPARGAPTGEPKTLRRPQGASGQENAPARPVGAFQPSRRGWPARATQPSSAASVERFQYSQERDRLIDKCLEGPRCDGGSSLRRGAQRRGRWWRGRSSGLLRRRGPIDARSSRRSDCRRSGILGAGARPISAHGWTRFQVARFSGTLARSKPNSSPSMGDQPCDGANS
jgi:hypothetical protein